MSFHRKPLLQVVGFTRHRYVSTRIVLYQTVIVGVSACGEWGLEIGEVGRRKTSLLPVWPESLPTRCGGRLCVPLPCVG